MVKRKAWDEAIKQVAKEAGTRISSGKPKDSKRETRRRVNARRWIATSDTDDLRRKVEARLEALEEANTEGDFAEADDDEWQDEEAVESTGRKPGRKAKAKASKKIKASKSGSGSGREGSSKHDMTELSKRYRPRGLAQILLEEHASQPDSTQLPGYVRAESAPSRLPNRRLCSVTGLVGRYREPNSGLSFANLAASEQLKDTPPPWLQLSGNAPYFEAIRYIKKECS